MALHRRTLLTAGGVGLAAALAGCIGGDGGGAGDGNGDGSGGNDTDGNGGETDDSDGSDAGDADETIQVGPGGDLVFDPAEVSVDVGATVEWVWDSDTHTVTPESIPEGSDWEGTGSTTHDAGHAHTHTFETEGQYDYYCEPHRSAGMEATLLVGDVTPEEDTETESPTEESGGDDGGGGDDGDDGYDY